jgi:hypothetical protein
LALRSGAWVEKTREGSNDPELGLGGTGRKQSNTHLWTVISSIAAVLAVVVSVVIYLFPRPPAERPELLPEDATVGPTKELKALDCSAAQSAKSTSSGSETTVEFSNKRTQPIMLYWINYDGEHESNGRVAPGQSEEFITYVSHPWLITDESGTCISVFLPTKEAGLATIR